MSFAELAHRMRSTGLLVALAPFVASCAVTSPQEINETYREALEQRRQQYQIKAGDVIEIRVLKGVEETLLSQPGLIVLPDGRCDGFFLHNYRFAGKSAVDVEKELSTNADFLRDVFGMDGTPEIAVVITPASERIVVHGQVERPGPLELEPGMTLNDALAMAGRHSITADSDYALLRRPHANVPAHPQLYRVDLNDYSEEILLLPRDEVYVPRNFLATVIAYVREYVFGVIPAQVYGSAVIGATL